jgi:hypothetical protein
MGFAVFLADGGTPCTEWLCPLLLLLRLPRVAAASLLLLLPRLDRYCFYFCRPFCLLSLSLLPVSVAAAVYLFLLLSIPLILLTLSLSLLLLPLRLSGPAPWKISLSFVLSLILVLILYQRIHKGQVGSSSNNEAACSRPGSGPPRRSPSPPLPAPPRARALLCGSNGIITHQHSLRLSIHINIHYTYRYQSMLLHLSITNQRLRSPLGYYYKHHYQR